MIAQRNCDYFLFLDLTLFLLDSLQLLIALTDGMTSVLKSSDFVPCSTGIQDSFLTNVPLQHLTEGEWYRMNVAISAWWVRKSHRG